MTRLCPAPGSCVFLHQPRPLKKGREREELVSPGQAGTAAVAWQGRAQDACKHRAVSVWLHEEWPSAWAAGNINELLIIAGLLSHTHPCIHAVTKGWDRGGQLSLPKKCISLFYSAFTSLLHLSCGPNHFPSLSTHSPAI